MNTYPPDSAQHECVELIAAIYRRHCAGCCLHIVTDDGNYETASVEFCLGHAREHSDCSRAASLLLGFSKTQRAKVSRMGRELANGRQP